MARAVLTASILLIAGLAWVWLYPMNMAPAAGTLVDGPAAQPMTWSVSRWIFLLTMWSVMMAGMMLPTALGTIVAVERRARLRNDESRWLVTGAFVLAYVTVWSGFAAMATLLQWSALRAGLMSPMMASASRWMSGLLLVTAGLFQLGPQKHACLRRCRSPLGFLLAEQRRGIGGAFVTGLRHGFFCVGCCWALMALLFVFGTMNLAAAAVLTALVLAEKVLPNGFVIALLAGAALVAVGAAVLAGLVT